MIHNKTSVAKILSLPVTTLFLGLAVLSAQDSRDFFLPAAQIQPKETAISALKAFDVVADQALAAMQKRTAELNVNGVAVVSSSEGDIVQSWSTGKK